MQFFIVEKYDKLEWANNPKSKDMAIKTFDSSGKVKLNRNQCLLRYGISVTSWNHLLMGLEK